MNGHYQILIVEDSPEDREFYRRALASDPNNNYQIHEVDSGDEALALIHELAIDLMLLDFQLPDMTGLELFREISDNIACVVPTIMLTGQGDESLAVRAMKLGVEDYLVKGKYSPAELRHAVESIVRKPAPEGGLNRGSLFAGRYEIAELAGSGGMSSVYRAIDRQTGRQVALKVIRNPDRRTATRFRREASVLASLSRPSIVQYLAHGMTPSGDRFLAMEWLEGEDLATRLTHGPLTIADTLIVATRIADALVTAHALGLIHRDIKPSNLFLPDAQISQAKLLDFGIVLTPQHGPGYVTRTGTAMGTPGYMAPEQALGLQDIDIRADIYAFGCVLYHCLAGFPPFSDAGSGSLTRSLLDPAPPVQKFRPDTPQYLADLVMRMLEQEVECRPQSVKTVLETLTLRQAVAPSQVPFSPPIRSKRVESSTRCALLLAARTHSGKRTGGYTTELSTQRVHLIARQRQIVEACGCVLTAFATGALQVVIPAKSSLTTELEIAVRCATKLRHSFPNQVIAIASNYDRDSGLSDPTGTLSRTRHILIFGQTGRMDIESEDRGLIVVDETSATLLAGRYQLTPHGPYYIVKGALPVSSSGI